MPLKKNRRASAPRLLSKSASSSDVMPRPQSASPIQPSPSLSQVIEEAVEEMTTRPISPPPALTIVRPPPEPQPPPPQPPARAFSPTPPRRVKSPGPIDPFQLDRPDSRLSVKRETILRGVIIKGIVCTPSQASCKQQVQASAAAVNKSCSSAKKQAPPPPKGEPKTKKQGIRSSMLIGRSKSAVPPGPPSKARPKSMLTTGSAVKSKK